MPLFDSLERDVSSFFVAQGSIFDSILKTVLERIATVESRVDHSVHVLSRLQQDRGFTSGDTGRSDNPEMEYYVMTLARQLNIVLALLFQPYANDAIAKRQASQEHLPSISDVLTDNESILMNFAATTGTIEPLPTAEDVKIGEPVATPPQEQAVIPILPEPSTVVEEAQHQEEEEQVVLEDQQPAVVLAESPRRTPRRSCKTSTFAMVHNLQLAEERREQQERELLHRMKSLLNDAHAHCHRSISTLTKELKAVRSETHTLRTDWLESHLERQQAADLAHAQQEQQQQKEMERQLLAISNDLLASQTTHEQQIAKLFEAIGALNTQFASKSDLDVVLQTARDDCIFGADAESLTRLQSDLMELQQMLRGEMASPAIAKLMEEVACVLELLQRLLSMLAGNADALHSPQGSLLMQQLRSLMSQLEDLAHDASSSQLSVRFLTDVTRQMELGTASLLEALEQQQERYQHTLMQQQTQLEQLRVDLHVQRVSDAELRKQLEGCPSQEETMRLVNSLREQIDASTSDSTTQLLGTVDDLRCTMAGLPTLEFLDKLLHSKADRSEIDRLRLLLAAHGPGGPSGPSLSKSPTRCLSCDQSLPHLQQRGESTGHHHHHHSHNQATERPHTAGSRPSSRSASPRHRPHHHSVIGTLPTPEEEEDASHESRYVSPFTRAMLAINDSSGGVSTLPSTHDILRDLAVAIDATRRRRQRLQSEELLESPVSSRRSKSLAITGATDDRRNRIPLRRPTLSDQVVYGPSITTGFLKPKKSIAGLAPTSRGSLGSARGEGTEPKVARPKTAVATSGGDVILRTRSSTVVIRPFSELSSRSKGKSNP